MSALNNNNSNTNDMNQVQGGVEAQGVEKEHKDDPTLYRTGRLEGSQPEVNDDTVVAIQLDGIVVVAGEDRGSPPWTRGTPQGLGVFPTQAQRASELAQAMQGGIHQGFKPSFAFNGKLAVAYGNRKGDKDPAANADVVYERAERCGYHATVPRAIEGEQEVKEVLNLVGGKDEAAVVLREQIMSNCFRELEAEDWSRWEHLLGRSIGWKDLVAAIRLSQCRAEAAQNHTELPQ